MAGVVGGDFEEDRQDMLDLEREKAEMKFVEHILCPRMEALGVKVRSEILRIDPVDDWGDKDISAILCKRAKELDPELMVLSKHSKNPMTTIFLGSTTQDCFRRAPCPVMFV